MKFAYNSVNLLLSQAATDPPRFESGSSLLLMFLQMLLSLGFVLGLAWLVIRVALPRLTRTLDARRLNSPGASSDLVRVVETVTLDQRSQLHLLEVAGRWFMVASSEAGVQVLAELDHEAAAREEAERLAAREQAGATDFSLSNGLAGRIARAFNQRK